jgi:hypothetical protein
VPNLLLWDKLYRSDGNKDELDAETRRRSNNARRHGMVKPLGGAVSAR